MHGQSSSAAQSELVVVLLKIMRMYAWECGIVTWCIQFNLSQSHADSVSRPCFDHTAAPSCYPRAYQRARHAKNSVADRLCISDTVDESARTICDVWTKLTFRSERTPQCMNSFTNDFDQFSKLSLLESKIPWYTHLEPCIEICILTIFIPTHSDGWKYHTLEWPSYML